MNQEWGPWVGEAGREYIFHVYGREEPIPSRQGIYIYCRQDPQGVWLPIYMGQGDLAVCCQDPDLLARIDAKGATHVHMRLCASPDERAAELADLLARYRNAYEPFGCNVAAPAAPPAHPAEAAKIPGAAEAPPSGSDPLAVA